jgi:hyperosmotically inducible protein
MKKINILSTCLLAGSLLLPVAGYTADGRTGDSAATFVKDSAITAKVKSQLAADSTTSAMRITVDTDNNGVVWLGGTAKSQAEADQAESIAKQTEGVNSVKNQIKIQLAR